MAVVKHIPLIAVHILIYGGLWAVAGFAGGLAALGLGALLVWISCRDIAIFEIPDVAVVMLIVIGVGIAPSFIWAVVAVLLWAALYLCIRSAARHAMGQEALGLGDVKLMGGLAAWVGILAPIYVTLLASVAAILAMVTLALIRGEKLNDITGTGIAFGPFLCLSAWGIWLWGPGF